MKFYTIAAVALAANLAEAFTLEDVNTAIKNQDFQPIADDVHSTIQDSVDTFNDITSNLNGNSSPFFNDLKDKFQETDLYKNVNDWYQNFEPTTIHDTYAMAKKTVRKLEERSPHT